MDMDVCSLALALALGMQEMPTVFLTDQACEALLPRARWIAMSREVLKDMKKQRPELFRRAGQDGEIQRLLESELYPEQREVVWNTLWQAFTVEERHWLASQGMAGNRPTNPMLGHLRALACEQGDARHVRNRVLELITTVFR
jgi:hypothetical protein